MIEPAEKPCLSSIRPAKPIDCKSRSSLEQCRAQKKVTLCRPGYRQSCRAKSGQPPANILSKQIVQTHGQTKTVHTVQFI
jgi:hypothetical protein